MCDLSVIHQWVIIALYINIFLQAIGYYIAFQSDPKKVPLVVVMTENHHEIILFPFDGGAEDSDPLINAVVLPPESLWKDIDIKEISLSVLWKLCALAYPDKGISSIPLDKCYTLVRKRLLKERIYTHTESMVSARIHV